MTDILLIQPPVKDFYITEKRTIPYGLVSIATILEQEGFIVDVFDGLATRKKKKIDVPKEMAYMESYYGLPDFSPFRLFHGYFHFGYSLDYIGDVAKRANPFLIGISANFTPYIDTVFELATIIKKKHKMCKIVVGGHHASILPTTVMNCDAIDFALLGEGELGMPLLAKAIQSNSTLENIPGLVFRKPNGAIHLQAPQIIDNLNLVPIPNFKFIKSKFYRRKQGAAATIVTSRGCPLKCSYCCIGNSYISYRRRAIPKIIEEIGLAVESFNVRFIDFEDETLSHERKWFLELLDHIYSRFHEYGLELRAMNGLLPSTLDEEVLVAMKRAGFQTLNLSLGSHSRDQLRRFNRPNIRFDFEKACFLAKKHELNIVAYIIGGAPWQPVETSLDDLLYLLEKRVLIGISVYYPVPGSQDYARLKEQGNLPASFALMRSSVAPISITASRLEIITLLRIGRIFNFIKSLRDEGIKIPHHESQSSQIKLDPQNKFKNGLKLLQWFLNDGKIRGINGEGEIFNHLVSIPLIDRLLPDLRKVLNYQD